MVYLNTEDRFLIIAGCCGILVLCLLTMVCKLAPWCWCHKCCPFRPKYEPESETLKPSSVDAEKQEVNGLKRFPPQEDGRLNTEPSRDYSSIALPSGGVHNQAFSTRSRNRDTTDSAAYSTDEESLMASRQWSNGRRASRLSSKSKRSRKRTFIDNLLEGSNFSTDYANSDTASLQEFELVKGELFLSLDFDSTGSRLRVHIRKVTNLSGRMQRRGKITIKMQALYSKSAIEKITSLFHRLKLSDSEVEENLTHEIYTRPKEPSNNIIVDESLTVPLKKEDIDKYCLRFVCIGYDKYSKGQPLCEALIALRDYTLEKEIDIVKGLAEPQKEEKGEVLIGLTYLPTSQKLSMSTLCVKGLKLAEQTDMNSVVFVKLAIARRGVHSKKRVHGKKAAEDIKWDETLHFDLPREHVHEVSMVVSVKQLVTDAGEFGEHVREHALGKAVLGLNSGTPSAQAHWRQVLQSPRQCVTQAHYIY